MERITASFILPNTILEKQGLKFLHSQIEVIEEDLKDQHNYQEISFVEFKEEKISNNDTEYILFFDVL